MANPIPFGPMAELPAPNNYIMAPDASGRPAPLPPQPDPATPPPLTSAAAPASAPPDLGAPTTAEPHLAGSNVPAGQEAHGSEYHKAAMRNFGEKEAALHSAAIRSPFEFKEPSDYTKYLGTITQARHELNAEKASFEREHPWGSMDSAHPGIGGKIGHVFGKIANVAGNAIAPGLMQSIPGTEANLAAQEAQGEAGAEKAGKAAQEAETAESQNQLRAAQSKEALANAEAKENPNTWKVVPGMTDEQGRVLQESAGGGLRWAPDITGAGPLKPNATEQPLGDRVAPLNQALTRRWQVLNPGQSLPSEYTLQPNATSKDFDRIDKVLSQNEQAVGTKAQRDMANEARKQTLELAQQNAADREEQRGLKWVMWTAPNGHQVAGSLSEAKAQGATDMAEVPAQEVRDIQNARHVVRLMTKTGDPKHPETNGVLQLIDELDREGKLGVLASRWNRYLTSGVGASPGDDPRIIMLINKNMLSDTGTMLAHFGASGGRSPQMLQHFLDLMNAGKMDGVTLRAGAMSIADYMHDRAMLPATGPEGTEKGGGGNTPPRPANVPPNYVFKENGPKGTGWYKP